MTVHIILKLKREEITMKNKKGLVLISSIGLVLLVLLASSLFASQSKWTKLGSVNYQLLGTNMEEPLVFEALQDKDKLKIAEAMDKNPGVEKKWLRARPDIVPQLKFKNITADNNLNESLEAETFEANFENLGEAIKVKISKMSVNGKNVLIPADPEYSNLPYGLVTSEDNTKGLIPTLQGLWLVDATKKETKKLTGDVFNGKSYNELTADLATRLMNSGSEGPATVWWNDNPMFNKSGSKIAYGTNRDCVETGGMSLWVYDIETGKEKPILKDNGQNFYKPLAWLDDELILAKRWDNGKPIYLIINTNGQTDVITLEGRNPELVRIFGDLIAYLPDSSTANKIMVGKIDFKSKTIKTLYEKNVEGLIQKWHGFNPFSPDGSKLAFIYVVDNQGTYQILVSDLEQKTETLVKKAPVSEARIQDFNWLDNNRLLVHVMEYGNIPTEISSWVYNLQGGN
jgi:hypothetical protein